MLVLTAAAFATDEPAGVVFTGSVSHHTPYCGGAAPPPELLRGQTTPRAAEVFVLKPGAANSEAPVAVTFRTDELGRFSVGVPPGTWCVVPAGRPRTPPKSTPPPGDHPCFVKLWEACEAVFDATTPSEAPRVVDLVQYGSCAWSQPCQPPGPPPP